MQVTFGRHDLDSGTGAGGLGCELGSAIGQVLGAIGTFAAVVVALWLAQRDRRDRQAAQARLVTVTVSYPEYGDPGQYVVPRVEITNHSPQPVHRPRIKKIEARPSVRWGREQTIYDEYSLSEELLAAATHAVPFEHFTTDGVPIDTTVAAGRIEKWVDVDAVMFTFTDAAGLRWRRTGNGEPVRVVQQAPAD